MRSFAPTILDTVKVQSFADFGNAEPHVDNMLLRGGEFDGLTDRVVDAFAEVIDKGGPKDCVVGLLHYMHGALCRPPADTPFNRPSGHILYNIVAPWQGTGHQPDKVAWAIATFEALKAVSSERTYLNYLCDEGDQYIRYAFGPHYERLRTIKRKFDPDNVFHNNRNISHRPAMEPYEFY